MVTSESGQVPFEAHIELLQWFLARRQQIVERVQELVNAQHKPLQYLENRTLLARHFEDCFFAFPAPAPQLAALRGQLQEAHWKNGFRPRDMPGIPNEMFDPAEMMTRVFRLWRQTRWPGRNGRLHWAQTLFNLYLVRSIALLTMRLWDAGDAGTGVRLAQLQGVLAALWKGSPADQPVLVRDARWLVPVAQSPTTDELAPYFEVAARIATSLSGGDRIEIHKAGVAMAGGHLRSQLRHFNMQGVALGETSLVLGSRRSNALDFAMTIQGLVPLLADYEAAVQEDDRGRRRELAEVICQGLSPDPELFLRRIDLLGAYSMIEHLFIAIDQHGHATCTATGARHVKLLRDYQGLLPRVIAALAQDCLQFRPVAGSYSPYGVLFGFSSNLIEHMAMKTLQADADTRFSLEDVFTGAGDGAAKLAWVSGWRNLPHVSQEVRRMYAYPQQFAEDIFARMEHQLRDASAGQPAAPATGRLFIAAGREAEAPSHAGIAELEARHVYSSDQQLVAANRAQFLEEGRLLLDRHEGEFIVSYRTPGGWAAISKDVLTDILGAGRDLRVTGLPDTAAQVLKLMCTALGRGAVQDG